MYRIDVDIAADRALDALVRLGAVDVESTAQGVAAILPDSVAPETAAAALGVSTVAISPAMARDDNSVWLLGPRPVRIGRLLIAPASGNASDTLLPLLPLPPLPPLPPLLPSVLTLVDGPAFGTGLHPTTALCLEAIEGMVDAATPARMLDVGTGSGILALAALEYGVPLAVGVDTDATALAVAAANARINQLSARLQLVHGGPDAVDGAWPFIVANVQAAPLIELAPLLTSRVAHGGTLLLSGIPVSVAADVERAYRYIGMRHLRTERRAGWTALLFTPSW